MRFYKLDLTAFATHAIPSHLEMPLILNF